MPLVFVPRESLNSTRLLAIGEEVVVVQERKRSSTPTGYDGKLGFD
jgi:hypothetical protein